MAQIINLLGLTRFSLYLSAFFEDHHLQYYPQLGMICRARTNKGWWPFFDSEEVGRIECQNEKLGLITVHLRTAEYAEALLNVATAYEKHNENVSVLIVVDSYDD